MTYGFAKVNIIVPTSCVLAGRVWRCHLLLYESANLVVDLVITTAALCGWIRLAHPPFTR